VETIKIGLIGFGTVGTGVFRLLKENRELIAERCGGYIDVVRIAAKNLRKKRALSSGRVILTRDVTGLLRDSQIQIIVELIGGIHPAKDFILEAFKNGKDVVTANKALLAECGAELFEAARKYGRNLFFEGSVGGGIPVIKSFREGLAGNHIKAIYGIVNGTSNYILSKMSLEAVDFHQALKEAQDLGYAEADPTLDLEGIDSAHKLTILASLAYGSWINFKKVYVEGITQISQIDIGFARQFGYTVKLLAIAKEKGDSVEARVHPTLIPSDFLLSSVHGVYNAVYYDGDYVGKGLLYGRGAGEKPTASAVVSDLVDAMRHLGLKNKRSPIVAKKMKKIQPIDDLECRCYLRFSALDQPGVLAKIAGILSEHKISISSVIQPERHKSGPVPVVIMTHRAKESDFRASIQKIDRLTAIKHPTLRIRVEEDEEK
jgi:homoserine dehydrogenase